MYRAQESWRWISRQSVHIRQRLRSLFKRTMLQVYRGSGYLTTPSSYFVEEMPTSSSYKTKPLIAIYPIYDNSTTRCM